MWFEGGREHEVAVHSSPVPIIAPPQPCAVLGVTVRRPSVSLMTDIVSYCGRNEEQGLWITRTLRQEMTFT
jgi:hypothetical protein